MKAEGEERQTPKQSGLIESFCTSKEDDYDATIKRRFKQRTYIITFEVPIGHVGSITTIRAIDGLTHV